MYRRVFPFLLTAVLLLSGCAAGQKNMPQKTDEQEMTGQPSDTSCTCLRNDFKCIHIKRKSRTAVLQKNSRLFLGIQRMGRGTICPRPLR